MNVKSVEKIIDACSNIKLCSQCDGEGKVWTELEFGDIPGDERQYDCPRCKGSGRTAIFKLEVLAEMPFNYKLGDKI